MTLLERWLRQPQGVWFRKALFQIHMWTGIGAGLYILAISLSGSAVVFRIETSRLVRQAPIVVDASGVRMTDERLTASAERAYPGWRVTKIWEPRRQHEAVDVWLERGGAVKQRLFDPYTGRDLARTIPVGLKVLDWVVDFHDNLLADRTGRLANGIGALFLLTLAATGLLIWWPGIASWRRSLTIRWSASGRRLTWDLHSAIGFWGAVLVFMWALTGVYLVFPEPFAAIVDVVTPPDDTDLTPRTGDLVLEWLAKLHFGRFAGRVVKAVWTVLGLVPSILFVTGALMWWNRVLRRRGHARGESSRGAD
jgi:uncharacterized iron-regulated membrane protein